MKKFISLIGFMVSFIVIGMCQTDIVRIQIVKDYVEVKNQHIKTDTTITMDTITNIGWKDTLITSVVAKRSFATNKDDNTMTILTLQDGHIVAVSSAHNYTIATDIVGSEYSYYTKTPFLYDDVKKIKSYSYDTTYFVTKQPKFVNLSCLRVSSSLYWDNSTHYFAKVYSHSNNKKYKFETTKSFYDQYKNRRKLTKKMAIKNKMYMPYKNYKCLYKEKPNSFFETIYDFVEVN